MMKYPIGIQSFEKIRQNGYIYVDKTDLVYKLAQGSICFLSRPRRFGKSLMVSTLKAYFEGRRDLFEGLRIAELEQDWLHYPIFHIDFNGKRYHQGGALHQTLEAQVAMWERQYGQPNPQATLGDRFISIMAEAHRQTGLRCVVLVDEYDKPMLDVLGVEMTTTLNGQPITVEEDNRQELKAFYSCFKAADEHLRFVMLTGVTKFSQVSVFSGFNQPSDLTLDARYEAICGITEEELYSCFAVPINQMAAKYKVTVDELKAGLKKRYDGYHFSEEMTDIYNPFSLLNTFDKMKLQDYWYATGSPEYLMRLLAKSNDNMMDLLGREYTPAEFADYRADVEKPLPMIFQSGYLTIKEAVLKGLDYRYVLDFPNDEVRRGFVEMLASNFFEQKQTGKILPWTEKMVDAMQVADLDLVRRLFTAFLAETPYSMRPKKDEKDRELYFHYTFYLILRLISCYTVYTEKQLSEGRADCIIETPQYVFIFEFKLDGTAEEALKQINERGYARAYEAGPRPIYKIGACFSSKTGTIEEWKIED
jgi:hypothetical protein